MKINKKESKKLYKGFIYALSVVFWIGMWQLAATLLHQELFLPAPGKVCQVLCQDLLFSGSFWKSAGLSLRNIGTGFLLGTLTGVLLAALSFWLRPVHILLWFPIKLIKSVPVASFVILALLWIPSSGLSMLIPFLMAVPTLYIHTLQGLLETDSRLLEMANVFRIPGWKRALFIYTPQTLPYIGSAASLAVGMAWKSGIAAEIIGLARNTIGNQLYQAKIYLLTPELFAWTIVIVMLSIGCEWILKGAVALLKKL